jgi:hypothetical protein
MRSGIDMQQDGKNGIEALFPPIELVVSRVRQRAHPSFSQGAQASIERKR